MFFFFFNDTATTEIYTLSLHDALPISCAVAIGDDATARHLHWHIQRQVDGGHLWIDGDQDHVRQENEVLPGDISQPLRSEKTGLLVVDDERPTAVDRHVEHAVSAAQRLAELGTVEDSERDSGQGSAVAGHHPPA